LSGGQKAVLYPGLGNRHFGTPVAYPSFNALAYVTGAFAGGGVPDVAEIGYGAVATLLNARLGATVRPVAVLVGTPAILSVSASGYGPLSYQWRKNGTPLADGGSISGATTATLTIDPAAFQDAGTYDVVVTDSCTTAASNAASLAVEFADVPPSNIFHGDIITIATAGVTAGCGGSDYCPSALVTRAQMAVFLLRSEHGGAYTPPPCTNLFADVPCPSAYADWIDQLANEGVTAGCGNGDYCPDASITRAQMAVFLLKTKLGSGYVPPAWTPIFGDVPSTAFAADWIDDLYTRGIAGGCSVSPLLYCPDNPINRGQMAAFLVNTFF
ncbi:MAG TPA: S-layer homology domain-containing protein, partial [Thermoanaerobaculia bacterium]|nr:S-layer homology domain-containing protein [Thermoanaerobaculia bacterium]